MDKIYGSPGRQDGLYKIGRNKWELIYGFGKDSEDDETGWNYRQRFNYRPGLDEIKNIIESQINADTDAKILSQFVWNGKPVWLSQENQMNFKAAYDLTLQTNGATLPIKFKLGENENGPIYHTFTKLEPFSDFILKVFTFINTTLNEGWKEKDSINYPIFEL